MPFIISFIAGCSTLIGYFFIYLDNRNNRVLIASLGFSSGVMFFISIFDLIPESIKLILYNFDIIISFIICLIFFVIGIILSASLNNFIDSSESYLYRIGIISMLAIIIHNVPEGIATYLTSTFDLKLGITLAFSIALHNIPEGISISIPIYYSTNSKIKAFVYTFIAGMSEFLGAILASIFFRKLINNISMGTIYSLIAGIMSYISINELFPTSLRYNRPLVTIISFMTGILFIFISLLLLH